MGDARLLGGRMLRVFLAMLLALLLVPATAPNAAQADEGTSEDAADLIAELLAAGDYVEGEALAIVDNAASVNLRSRGVDLLDSAEPLLSVSAETYAAATGEDLPAKDLSDGIQLLSSEEPSSPGDAVSVVRVRQEGASTEDLLKQLQDDPRVLWAEPNYAYDLADSEQEALEQGTVVDLSEQGSDSLSVQDTATTNAAEPAATGASSSAASTTDLAGYQWGCSNTGETMVKDTPESRALVGFDINPPHWNETGATNATGVVAVLDSGVDYTHPDLDGVTCDMSEYVAQGLPGGQYGFNTLDGEDAADTMDNQYHGTYCAGLIASEWNGSGTSGVASGVQVLAVKASKGGIFEWSSILAGYSYLDEAVDMGLPLKAVNNSWGSNYLGRTFDLAVTQLGEKGVISVLSAGNAGINLDENRKIPQTSAGNPYVVRVDGSNAAGGLLSFRTGTLFTQSNYGVETTDVVAPGQQLLSTAPQSASSYMTEADANPLSYNTFDDSAVEPGVRIYGLDAANNSAATSDAPIGGVVSGESHYDAVGGSYKISVEDMTLNENEDFPGSECRSVVLSVPVGDAAAQESLQYVGMKLLVPLQSGGYAIAQYRIKYEDGTLSWTPYMHMAYSSDGWLTLSGDVPALVKKGDKWFPPASLAYTADGELEVKLTLVQPDWSNADAACYIDSVGVGATGAATPYRCESGTSGAAPMVTGAAMILADPRYGLIDPAAPADERAKTLVKLIKASVRPADENQDFTGICATGGQIDLGIALGVAAPNLAGLTEADALAALEAAGLRGVAGTPEYSDTVTAGQVIRQDIAAGTNVEANAEVVYVLSLGKEPLAPAEPANPTVPVTPAELSTPQASNPADSDAQAPTALAKTSDGLGVAAAVALLCIVAGVCAMRVSRRFR